MATRIKVVPATKRSGLRQQQAQLLPSVQLADQHFQQLFSSLVNINAKCLNDTRIKGHWKPSFIGYFNPTADDKATTNGSATWNDVEQFTDSILENATVERQLAIVWPQLSFSQKQLHVIASCQGKSLSVRGFISSANSCMYLQQQWLNYCRKVVTASYRHGALFDKNLQAVKDAIKTRKQA